MSTVTVGLQKAVANTSVLLFLTLNAHWNIVGADFFQLHKALNDQYEILFDTLDILAERMRALDSLVQVNLTAFDQAAAMPTLPPKADGRAMITTLVAAHDKNVADLKAVAMDARTQADTVTENMLLSIIEAEQKTLWMLKSYLKG